jgi:type II secretory pathway component PulF
MPVYEYTGVNAAGKKVKGVYDAESPRALRDHLKAQQIFLTEQTEGKSKQERKAGEVAKAQEDMVTSIGNVRGITDIGEELVGAEIGRAHV